MTISCEGCNKPESAIKVENFITFEIPCTMFLVELEFKNYTVNFVQMTCKYFLFHLNFQNSGEQHIRQSIKFVYIQQINT
jgi:hypothetical protein